MKTRASGVLAGIVAATALATPALGAPANVTVRVEGTGATLVPETRVTTTTAPVERDGHACPGTSALGALHAATGGDWTGTYYPGFSDWIVEGIEGERHAYPDSGSWALWLNAGYTATGLCSTELQEGDDVLLAPADAGPVLDLRDVPATATAGQPVTVRVEEHGVTTNPDWSVTPFDGPAAGATVTYGDASTTTGPDGRAQLVFAAPGTVTVQAAQADHVRSVTRTVQVASAAGPAQPAPPAPPVATADMTAPVAAFSPALADGRVFSRRRAPRELSGAVSDDPSGLRSVRLSILRRRGDRCWTFRDTTERFKRHRCGGRWYFRLGDRAAWSYLLPRRLPAGRYTIGVMAVDKALNESRATVEIRVR